MSITNIKIILIIIIASSHTILVVDKSAGQNGQNDHPELINLILSCGWRERRERRVTH